MSNTIIAKEVIVNIRRVACLVLLVGALTGGLANGDTPSKPGGDTLMDFTLKSLDGKEISLKQFRGKKPVLVVVGASW